MHYALSAIRSGTCTEINFEDGYDNIQYTIYNIQYTIYNIHTPNRSKRILSCDLKQMAEMYIYALVHNDGILIC